MVMNHLLMLQRMLLNERTVTDFSNIQGFGSKRNAVEYVKICGPGNSVGIVTGYGLDGSGIESRRGRIFRTCPDRPWGPPSLLYNGYRVFPRGKEQPGRDAVPSPPSSAVGHERLELYLYSPYGPYGLYRSSVAVQGCNLPLPYVRIYNPPAQRFEHAVWQVLVSQERQANVFPTTV